MGDNLYRKLISLYVLAEIGLGILRPAYATTSDVGEKFSKESVCTTLVNKIRAHDKIANDAHHKLIDLRSKLMNEYQKEHPDTILKNGDRDPRFQQYLKSQPGGVKQRIMELFEQSYRESEKVIRYILEARKLGCPRELPESVKEDIKSRNPGLDY